MRPAALLASMICLAAASSATPALADICAWNSPAVAGRAAAMLRSGDTVQSFCPGCGDTVAKPLKVNAVTTAPVSDPTYSEVMVNGHGIDLAYTYVRTAPGSPWTNLGALVSCSSDNDSPRTLRPDQVSAEATQGSAPQGAPVGPGQASGSTLAQTLGGMASPAKPPPR